MPHAAPRVLIADDENLLRNLTARVLERAGFRAQSAATSDELLAHLSNREPPAVLVLDFTIVPAGGNDLVHKVRELAPGLPLVLTSGDRLPPESRGVLDPPRVVFLAKPYAPKALIHAVLEAAGA